MRNRSTGRALGREEKQVNVWIDLKGKRQQTTSQYWDEFVRETGTDLGDDRVVNIEQQVQALQGDVDPKRAVLESIVRKKRVSCEPEEMQRMNQRTLFPSSRGRCRP